MFVNVYSFEMDEVSIDAMTNAFIDQSFVVNAVEGLTKSVFMASTAHVVHKFKEVSRSQPFPKISVLS